MTANTYKGPCARHCSKHFMCINSFNSQSDPQCALDKQTEAQMLSLLPITHSQPSAEAEIKPKQYDPRAMVYWYMLNDRLSKRRGPVVSASFLGIHTPAMAKIKLPT